MPPRVTKGRRAGMGAKDEWGNARARGGGGRRDKGVSWGLGLGGRALHRVVPVIPSLGDGGELFGTSLGNTCEPRRSRAHGNCCNYVERAALHRAIGCEHGTLRACVTCKMDARQERAQKNSETK